MKTVAALVILIGLTAMLAFITARCRRWARGRSERFDWIRSALDAPRRYLVHVHKVVIREPTAAWMHVLSAAGFTISLILLLALWFVDSKPSIVVALEFVLTCTLAGAVLAVWRRTRHTSRQSMGLSHFLPVSLMLWSISIGLLAAPTAEIDMEGSGALVLMAAVSTALIFSGLMLGPARHALYGMAHLAFHERRDRFEPNSRSTALRSLDLDQRPLGASRIENFRWTQLLSFDACVECGKCEAACPAMEAELPLNPKALIQDLARAESVWQLPYAGHGHPGAVSPLSGRLADNALVRPETLWACTTCRACVEECPMLIEHVDAVMDLRRFATLETGLAPGRANDVLMNMRETDNPEGADPSTRLHWANDLSLKVLPENGRVDVLLWMGNGAFEPRNQQTLRAVVQLLQLAGVDFAVLGEEELDCGDVARRLGEEAVFQGLARRNIRMLQARKFERILTVDPHVLHCLRNEYPAMGGYFNVVHHSAFLLELIREGRLKATAPADSVVTYHDPCYLARYNGETEAPRELLRAVGFSLIEMERSGRKTSCCGGGGGLPITDIPGKRRIADVRMDHVRVTQAPTLAVACPGCMNMLGAVSEPRPNVRDLADLVLEAVVH